MAMKRPALQDLVVLTSVRALRAQQDVSFQREIVSNLQRAGRDATQALDRLAALERIETTLVEGRDLVAALAARFAPEPRRPRAKHLASESLSQDGPRSPLEVH